MRIKYRLQQWGITFMIPFTLTLIILIGGTFLGLFFLDQSRQDRILEADAKNLTNGVLATRSVFAKNQDLINRDSNGNYEFKHLNPAAAASQYIEEVNRTGNIKIKQTSDLFRNIKNAPDEWEKKTIQIFKDNPNLTYYSEKVHDTEPLYRYAIPLVIGESCLQCHGGTKGEFDISGYPREGYQVGELRGVISVIIPLTEYQSSRYERTIFFIILTLAIIILTWLVGQRMVKALQKVANTDRLTQVNNRNVFYTQLELELNWANKRRAPLALIMLDIDYFKKINDQYGHLGGDEILRQLAKEIQGLLRQGDTLARFGGEEFIIIVPNTDQEGAYALAERIRMHVANYPFRIESTQIQVTISAGITVLNDELFNIEKIKELLTKQADEALYKAKHNGRNRVEKYKNP